MLVEGQTEEILSRNLFAPFLEAHGWSVSASVLTTKRLAGGSKVRGGIQSWEKIRREISILLHSSFDIVTTIIDYYGFPADAPGMTGHHAQTAIERVRYVEQALADAINDPRFVPHLTLHETEAWVFAAADTLGSLLDDRTVASDLRAISEKAGGPELINDNPATAPSKRLQERLPAYQKTLHGPLCVEELGIAALRTECPHFDSWLVELERRAGG